jgi:hypothetical protein
VVLQEAKEALAKAEGAAEEYESVVEASETVHQFESLLCIVGFAVGLFNNLNIAV